MSFIRSDNALTQNKNSTSQNSQAKSSPSVTKKLINETVKFFGIRPIVYDTLKTAIEPEESEAEREERKWQQRRFRHLNNEYGVCMDAMAAELHRGLEPIAGVSEHSESEDEDEAEATEEERLSSGFESSSVCPPKFNAAFHARCSTTDAEAAKKTIERTSPSFSPPIIIEARQSVVKMALDTLGGILSGRAFQKSRRHGSSFSSANNSLARPAAGSCDAATLSDEILLNVLGDAHSGGWTGTFASQAYYRPIFRDRNLCGVSTSFPTFFCHYTNNNNTLLANGRMAHKVDSAKLTPKLTNRGMNFSINSSASAPLADDDLFFDMVSSQPRHSNFNTSVKTRKQVNLEEQLSFENSDKPSTSNSQSASNRPGEHSSLQDECAKRTPLVEFCSINEHVGIEFTSEHESVGSTLKERIFQRFRSIKRNKEENCKRNNYEKNRNSGFRPTGKEFLTRDGYQAVRPSADEVLKNNLHACRTFKKAKKTHGKRSKRLPICGSIDPMIARQLKDESYDYRPFFTFWITIVQVLIMAVMLIRYEIGTDFSNIFGVIERSGDVTSTFLSMIHIVVWEQNNVWIGPRFADLVQSGAKYTPCMRQDANIREQILAERREEALNTGCCIGAEGGCFQGSECPKQFAKLVKWSNSVAENDNEEFLELESPTRVVCGQDPKYCIRPPSVPPFEWSKTDISKWPSCEENRADKLIPRRAEHMHCEVTGRPCCIQMHGQCRITTREYCDFVRGHFHANATLCSQVSCLNSVCGMTPFLSADRPDQIYRLITPLFIHAGIIRCGITVILQMKIMRSFEVMIGWLRLSMIYFLSGIGGYLASAIFVPYMPEVGPAGSQGGVLGALIVNVLYNWNFLRYPMRTLTYHLGIALTLFVTGFLPFVDNSAQLFGFIFGCFLAAALIPYIVIGSRDVTDRRIFIVCASLLALLLLFATLFTLFYTHPTSSFINHAALRWLNCPFAGKVCEQQGLFLRSWLPI